MIGNHSKSVKAKGGLTATPTGGAGTKVENRSFMENSYYCGKYNTVPYSGCVGEIFHGNIEAALTRVAR